MPNMIAVGSTSTSGEDLVVQSDGHMGMEPAQCWGECCDAGGGMLGIPRFGWNPRDQMEHVGTTEKYCFFSAPSKIIQCQKSSDRLRVFQTQTLDSISS